MFRLLISHVVQLFGQSYGLRLLSISSFLGGVHSLFLPSARRVSSSILTVSHSSAPLSRPYPFSVSSPPFSHQPPPNLNLRRPLTPPPKSFLPPFSLFSPASRASVTLRPASRESRHPSPSSLPADPAQYIFLVFLIYQQIVYSE